jgi:hypothetical protein
VEPEEVAAWARRFAESRVSHVVRSTDEIRDLFEKEGFEIGRLDANTDEQERRTRPSGPRHKGSRRVRIVATRRG